MSQPNRSPMAPSILAKSMFASSSNKEELYSFRSKKLRSGSFKHNDQSYDFFYIADEDGEIWIKSKEIWRLLNYKNENAALKCVPRRFTEEWKNLRIRASSNSQQLDENTIFINRKGIDTLILNANHPLGDEIKSFLVNQVFPQIRENGYYVHDSQAMMTDSMSQHHEMVPAAAGSELMIVRLQEEAEKEKEKSSQYSQVLQSQNSVIQRLENSLQEKDYEIEVKKRKVNNVKNQMVRAVSYLQEIVQKQNGMMEIMKQRCVPWSGPANQQYFVMFASISNPLDLRFSMGMAETRERNTKKNLKDDYEIIYDQKVANGDEILRAVKYRLGNKRVFGMQISGNSLLLLTEGQIAEKLENFRNYQQKNSSAAEKMKLRKIEQILGIVGDAAIERLCTPRAMFDKKVKAMLALNLSQPSDGSNNQLAICSSVQEIDSSDDEDSYLETRNPSEDYEDFMEWSAIAGY